MDMYIYTTYLEKIEEIFQASSKSLLCLLFCSSKVGRLSSITRAEESSLEIDRDGGVDRNGDFKTALT